MGRGEEKGDEKLEQKVLSQSERKRYGVSEIYRCEKKK